MLSEKLREMLVAKIRENPKEAIKELEKDPRILKFLLDNEVELKATREQVVNERIKYVNMTQQMEADLKSQAERLRTTQGLLLGAGVLFLLELLNSDR